MIEKKEHRALARIERALHELEAELGRHHRGEGQVSNVAQLSAFRAQLIGMKSEIEARQLSGRYLGMGRAIADSWSWDEPLGDVLLDAEQEYKRLC